MIRNSSNVKKTLTPKNRKELSDWLAENELDVNTIHRMSTDCVVIAKLVKKFNPRLVDLYLYPERTTMKLKLENWQKFSTKVLKKLNLPTKPADLQMFVNGDKDAISLLLFSIMRLQEKATEKPKDGGGDADAKEDINSPIFFKLDREIDGKMVKVDKKMINYLAYEELRKKINEYDREIEVASKKVVNLEKQVAKKADDIDELVTVLAQQAVTKAKNEESAKEKDQVADHELLFEDGSDDTTV